VKQRKLLGLNLGKLYLAKQANLPLKQVATNSICLEIKVMPPPQHRHVKKDMCIISNDGDFLFTPHKNKGKQPNVTKLSISKNNSCVQHAF
jgi:hypothetical protein